MSPVLMFTDSKWFVCTSSWTVAAKGNGNVSLCYPWSAISGAGWLDQATGVARTELAINIDEFHRRLHRGDAIIDLREVSTS